MADAKNYFIYADHLNAPRAIADELGKVAWRWDSEAFGTTPANEDPDQDGKVFSYNLRFPGQYFDQSTGLHYNGFRDYDPAIGRYIESDPIGLVGGINTYAYTGSNSINRTDALGLSPEEDQEQFSQDLISAFSGGAIHPGTGQWYDFVASRYYKFGYNGNGSRSGSSVIQAKTVAKNLNGISTGLGYFGFLDSVNDYCKDNSNRNTVALGLSTAGLMPGWSSFISGWIQVGLSAGQISGLEDLLGASYVFASTGFDRDKTTQILSEAMGNNYSYSTDVNALKPQKFREGGLGG